MPENQGASFAQNPLAQNINYFGGPSTKDDTGNSAVNSSGLPLYDKENPSNSELTQTPELISGVPSFMNPYALIAFPTRYDGSAGKTFNTILDDPSSSMKFSSSRKVSMANLRNIEPSVYNLVNLPPDGSASENGAAWYGAKMPYRYTDFLYCKYYGKIPNNYLITLRRYPAPTFDNLDIPLVVNQSSNNSVNTWDSDEYGFKPIAQAVTWIGEETGNKLSEMLGFEVNLAWQAYESQVETVLGNEQDASEGPDMFQTASKFITAIGGVLGAKVNSRMDEQNYAYDPYANGPYSHRVYGPVNVIAKTHKRARGLDFKQSFALNFHYSLKSISSINPKAAMLDIIANMLQLTYNNAAFWGGANRYFARKPVYPFLGGREGMNAWYRGDPQGFIRSVGKQLTDKNNGLLTLFGNFFDKLQQDPIAALKALAVNGMSVGMKMIGQGRAPDIVAMKALLTGEPVGEWHMVVGNPYSPIVQVGNLICTGAKFQFNDALGADNFPTELKVEISLEHGRPRDKGDIESMFNEGEGRIYYAPKGGETLFRSAAQEQSKTDNSWSKAARAAAVRQYKSYPKLGYTGSVGNLTAPAKIDVIQGSMSTSDRAKFNSQLEQSAKKFDEIVDDLKRYGELGAGHSLALRMGLASAGKYTTHKGSGTIRTPDTKTRNGQ